MLRAADREVATGSAGSETGAPIEVTARVLSAVIRRLAADMDIMEVTVCVGKRAWDRQIRRIKTGKDA